MTFVKTKDLSLLSDEELAARRARKEQLVQNAHTHLTEADAEVERCADALTRARMYESPAVEIEQEEQKLDTASAAARGMRGGLGAAQKALDDCIAEQTRRTAAQATETAETKERAMREQAKRTADALTVMSEQVVAMLSDLRERINESRQAAYRARVAKGEKPLPPIFDEYDERTVLEVATTGAYEVAHTLEKFKLERLDAQITQRNAAAARDAALARARDAQLARRSG